MTLRSLLPRRQRAHRRGAIGIRALAVLSSVWGVLLPVTAGDFLPPAKTSDGFAVPQPGRRFEFPRDHGSHPEFKIEWWYVTGHLYGETGRRFGFQATFFRRAGPLPRNGTAVPNASALFGEDELHLAHMALLDVRAGRFLHEERLNRAGWDAAASLHTLAVRNGNWSLRSSTNAHGPWSLHGSIRGEAAFAFELNPAKPLVVFGENGVSRKGASPTAASYYLTFPRLEVAGRLTLAGREHVVRGQAWMDHEISSSQLEDEQAGWDWAGVQLQDGREIMAYRMRRKDGSTDPFSTLAWVDASGQVTHFNSAQFTWTPVRTWKSPVTGGVYPVEVKLTTTDPATGQPVTFTIEPLALPQELRGGLSGVAYWEGACRVRDEAGAEVGSAYLELAGYVGSLTERFR